MKFALTWFCCIVWLTGLLGREVAGQQTSAGQFPHTTESTTVGFRLPALWEYSKPLIAPERRAHEPSHAQKDPTLVFHDGKWHVFMTVKLPARSAIEYCSFTDWEDANKSARTILKVSESDYYCAPQVFYFTPHKKWYLIYQMGVPNQDKMWVAYSTTPDISDPTSWSNAATILDGGRDDPREVGGLDYWIICDYERTYLFYTSLDGLMWRLWTKLEDFPHGFHDCQVALTAKIFEASHTYRLKGMDKYLTIVEEDGRRYYKAFVADRLDGRWTPIADSPENAFASWKNIRPAKGVEPWTDNVSHGELIRDGIDQTLTVDPNNLKFVFQGMLDEHKSGHSYGQFQWRIGMLTPVAHDSEERLSAHELHLRGEDHFRYGRIKESIADFDRQLALEPGRAAEHWQRGISYYYAGEYEKGARQFELHRTVNPQDVENAAWHFLCVTRAPAGSVELAREKLIPVTRDARVPMAQIQRMFAGTGTPDEVLQVGEEAGGMAKFYAELYVGLYYEALGREEESLRLVASAAANAAAKNHYMGDVARVHVLLRQRR
jgi:tetratricopeptide (TPR) repeat protein